MRFIPLPIEDAFLIDLELQRDDRGFFARVLCDCEFRRRGLAYGFVQSNISVTEKLGTVRGMHYQNPPFQEGKLVRCVRGAIFDVLLDVRQGSPSFGKWHAEILRAEEYRALYLGPGIAHGFQTLADDTEVNYWMSQYHHPPAEAGIRFDDPILAIEWPLDATLVSSRDLAWPSLKETVGP